MYSTVLSRSSSGRNSNSSNHTTITATLLVAIDYTMALFRSWQSSFTPIKTRPPKLRMHSKVSKELFILSWCDNSFIMTEISRAYQVLADPSTRRFVIVEYQITLMLFTEVSSRRYDVSGDEEPQMQPQFRQGRQQHGFRGVCCHFSPYFYSCMNLLCIFYFCSDHSYYTNAGGMSDREFFEHFFGGARMWCQLPRCIEI